MVIVKKSITWSVAFCLSLLYCTTFSTFVRGQVLTIRQQPRGVLFTVAGLKGHRGHLLEIDDAASFTRPVYRSSIKAGSLLVDRDHTGLIEGLDYFARIDGGPQVRFRLLSTEAGDRKSSAVVSCTVLRKTWENEGRFTVGTALSGLTWSGSSWQIKPHSYLLGESLYNAELVLRPAIAAARACRDNKILDELAAYYLIMLQQTEKVDHLLHRPNLTSETRRRLLTSDAEARTISATFGQDAGEGELYNAQWLHPAALLVRIVSTLPEMERSVVMKKFAKEYADFLVHDQLERVLYQQQMPPLGGESVKGRVAYWRLAITGKKGLQPWDSDVSDIDLWWLASAAEVLGANANDPDLIDVNKADETLLREALLQGTKFLSTERAILPQTRDFTGKVVGSATYFDGDDANDADSLYSGNLDETYPTPANRVGIPKISWDSSHSYRLACLMRSLYENRKVLGSIAPSLHDVQLVANQYVYKVFDGDFTRPRFRNYFDGNDGWFRVGYAGDGFGVPPSSYCDMHNAKRPCLTPGVLMAWGELSFANPDLLRLEKALMRLAFTSDASVAAFRERHYFFNKAFSLDVVEGVSVYGGALYFIAAENADQLARDQMR